MACAALSAEDTRQVAQRGGQEPDVCSAAIASTQWETPANIVIWACALPERTPLRRAGITQ